MFAERGFDTVRIADVAAASISEIVGLRREHAHVREPALPIIGSARGNHANEGTDYVLNSAILQHAVPPDALQWIAKVRPLARSRRVAGVDDQCRPDSQQSDRLVANISTLGEPVRGIR